MLHILPTLSLESVFHVGTLNPALRGQNGAESHEGSCLSVSMCPSSWRSIARLGDSPTWMMSHNCRRGVFVDVLRALAAPEVVAQLTKWGIAAGLAERCELWRAWTTDESGDWRYTVHRTQAEAEQEVDDLEDVRENGAPVVDSMPFIVGTPTLCERVKVRLAMRDALEYLLLAWAEDNLPDVDGLWWNEEHDPYNYSAPRGGIFPSRLPQWSAQQTCPRTKKHFLEA